MCINVSLVKGFDIEEHNGTFTPKWEVEYSKNSTYKVNKQIIGINSDILDVAFESSKYIPVCFYTFLTKDWIDTDLFL